MDVWRQWIRHRTANINEYSTRYSIAIDAAQKTAADKWRRQSAENKQGSVGFLSQEDGALLSSAEEQLQRSAREVYEARLTAGVAREQARKDLPLSTVPGTAIQGYEHPQGQLNQQDFGGGVWESNCRIQIISPTVSRCYASP
jgi:thymidylate synthase ThyX